MGYISLLPNVAASGIMFLCTEEERHARPHNWRSVGPTAPSPGSKRPVPFHSPPKSCGHKPTSKAKQRQLTLLFPHPRGQPGVPIRWLDCPQRTDDALCDNMLQEVFHLLSRQPCPSSLAAGSWTSRPPCPWPFGCWPPGSRGGSSEPRHPAIPLPVPLRADCHLCCYSSQRRRAARCRGRTGRLTFFCASAAARFGGLFRNATRHLPCPARPHVAPPHHRGKKIAATGKGTEKEKWAQCGYKGESGWEKHRNDPPVAICMVVPPFCPPVTWQVSPVWGTCPNWVRKVFNCSCSL